jgi:hypothetical protein
MSMDGDSCEEVLAVVAAEQEDEPVDVSAEAGRVIGVQPIPCRITASGSLSRSIPAPGPQAG